MPYVVVVLPVRSRKGLTLRSTTLRGGLLEVLSAPDFVGGQQRGDRPSLLGLVVPIVAFKVTVNPCRFAGNVLMPNKWRAVAERTLWKVTFLGFCSGFEAVSSLDTFVPPTVSTIERVGTLASMLRYLGGSFPVLDAREQRRLAPVASFISWET
ncbi:hypothetical protein TGP89_226880 [Toxoplasma gondii p89]|uniref:Uncharacterized protein n=1 Tax=Toxoplasma gondii p89 TaxID=943119 RepID=A0A086KDQ5_TOXGO|nr:hypothetical protein TGP89_226880 [Toxoplasma gondii p89]